MTFHPPTQWSIPVHVDHHGRPDCLPACDPQTWGTPTALARPGECGSTEPHAPHPYGADVLGQNLCAGVEPEPCHCGAPVAAVADPAQYAALGRAPYALCVRCLNVRCDAHPGACEPGVTSLSDFEFDRRVAAANRERRRRITSRLARPTYYAACLFLLWLPTWSADHGHEPLRDHGARGLLIASAAVASALVLLWHAPRKDNRP